MATAVSEMPLPVLGDFPPEINLSLIVRDPETIVELWQRHEGEKRDTFALSALRLGVLALRQASGAVDNDDRMGSQNLALFLRLTGK
jgi:hypothetical protein